MKRRIDRPAGLAVMAQSIPHFHYVLETGIVIRKLREELAD